MRIAIISANNFPACLPWEKDNKSFYGSEMYNAILAQEFIKNGHQVEFFAPTGSSMLGKYHALYNSKGYDVVDERLEAETGHIATLGDPKLDHKYLLGFDFVIDASKRHHNIEELFLYYKYPRFCNYGSGFNDWMYPERIENPYDRHLVTHCQYFADLYKQHGMPADVCITGDTIINFENLQSIQKLKPKTSYLYKIKFDNSCVECTPDHKFLTTNGWVMAKDLLVSDICYIDRNNNNVLDKGRRAISIETLFNNAYDRTSSFITKKNNTKYHIEGKESRFGSSSSHSLQEVNLLQNRPSRMGEGLSWRYNRRRGVDFIYMYKEQKESNKSNDTLHNYSKFFSRNMQFCHNEITIKPLYRQIINKKNHSKWTSNNNSLQKTNDEDDNGWNTESKSDIGNTITIFNIKKTTGGNSAGILSSKNGERIGVYENYRGSDKNAGRSEIIKFEKTEIKGIETRYIDRELQLVYDITTDNHWFLANNIVVHNCHFGIPDFWCPKKDSTEIDVYADYFYNNDWFSHYFLFPHRPVYYKGVITLLRLAKDFPNENFVVATSTPLPDHIDSMTWLTQNKTKNIHIIDVPQGGEYHYYRRALLRNAQALLAPFEKTFGPDNPTPYHETGGLISMEALACGTPVIVSRSPGSEELLGHQSGAVIFIDGYDAARLAIKHTDFLSLEPDPLPWTCDNYYKDYMRVIERYKR